MKACLRAPDSATFALGGTTSVPGNANRAEEQRRQLARRVLKEAEAIDADGMARESQRC